MCAFIMDHVIDLPLKKEFFGAYMGILVDSDTVSRSTALPALFDHIGAEFFLKLLQGPVRLDFLLGFGQIEEA